MTEMSLALDAARTPSTSLSTTTSNRCRLNKMRSARLQRFSSSTAWRGRSTVSRSKRSPPRTERGCQRPRACRSATAIEESHEAEIHMLLHMAMEEAAAGLIGRKVDCHRLKAAEHRHVFDDATRRMPGNGGELEAVAMQMDRMNIVGGVRHTQAIAPAAREAKERLHL